MLGLSAAWFPLQEEAPELLCQLHGSLCKCYCACTKSFVIVMIGRVHLTSICALRGI